MASLPEPPPGWHWEQPDPKNSRVVLVKDEVDPRNVTIECQGSITLPSIGTANA